VDDDLARRLFGGAPVARMATVRPAGTPHVVPVDFALDDDTIRTAVDSKRKRTTALQRLTNLTANPAVSLVVDHYDDDWSALWWVRADGMARLHEPGSEGAGRGVAALTAAYPQYADSPPPGRVVEVIVHRWSTWTAQ
jgi:PPOX class probable F420-dependent enzyme